MSLASGLVMMILAVLAAPAHAQLSATITRRLEPSMNLSSIRLVCEKKCTISRVVAGRRLKVAATPRAEIATEVEAFFASLAPHAGTALAQTCDNRFSFEVRLGDKSARGCVTARQEHDADFLDKHSALLESVQTLEKKLFSRLESR